MRGARRRFDLVASLALALLAPVAGCGDVTLEGPQREWPDPSCPRHEVLDPWDGTCKAPPCQWDEDCPNDHRCDWIEGRCVRATGGGVIPGPLR